MHAVLLERSPLNWSSSVKSETARAFEHWGQNKDREGASTHTEKHRHSRERRWAPLAEHARNVHVARPRRSLTLFKPPPHAHPRRPLPYQPAPSVFSLPASVRPIRMKMPAIPPLRPQAPTISSSNSLKTKRPRRSRAFCSFPRPRLPPADHPLQQGCWCCWPHRQAAQPGIQGRLRLVRT